MTRGKSIGRQCIVGAVTFVIKNAEDNYMVWSGEKVVFGRDNLTSQKGCAA